MQRVKGKEVTFEGLRGSFGWSTQEAQTLQMDPGISFASVDWG